MKIWSSHLPKEIPSFDLIKIGSFQQIDKKFENFKENNLIEIKEIINLKCSIRKNDAFFIPAGYFKKKLLEFVTKYQCLIYIGINGMGDHAIKNLLKLFKKIDSVLVFEADDCEKFEFLENLGWLSSQKHPFAIASDDREKLLTSCFFKPEALIIKNDFIHWISELEYFYSLTLPHAAKPLSVSELDALDGAEIGLVVANDLPAGHLLKKEDITTRIVNNRSVGIHLEEIILGQKLRYSLKKGEPITFGFLQDPKYA